MLMDAYWKVPTASKSRWTQSKSKFRQLHEEDVNLVLLFKKLIFTKKKYIYIYMHVCVEFLVYCYYFSVADRIPSRSVEECKARVDIKWPKIQGKIKKETPHTQETVVM